MDKIFGRPAVPHPSPEVATNDAVRLNWYFEERIHNYTCNCNKNSGQFTQIVWKSSREMGFGVATVGNFTAACALYYPRGNIKEEFLENVLSP
ncbi:Golgi-associated plant pathogenesis-related protein 1 [Orchesella cincta]|uniref:Golgi-associated plant pathogenesis-related protein 1 n=1 Tax=Orchesella cincta TaxID=48709 RepID=A0A1D2MJ31_ORCCI|nr:Golgi-associated plant pathogenesis-related protein 1 [Orchesella cincta]